MNARARQVARYGPTSMRAVNDTLIIASLSGTTKCGGRTGHQELTLAKQQ